MSCWCNDCQNTSWCTCPNLQIEWCGTVDSTNPNTTILHIPCVNIISWDNSLNVDKTVMWDDVLYDIRWNTNLDRKVGACYGDNNPWYLFNQKLRVNTTWPLTYNLHNCPWDSYVEICFDETKLEYPETLQCNCPWGGGSIDCDVNCSNCNIQPKAMTELLNNVTIIQPTWQEKNYYIAWAAISELDNLWWTRVNSQRSNIWTYGWMTNNSWVITICRDWVYEFIIEWSQEQNKWAHASRVGLLLITPTGSIKTLTQTRYSGTDSYFWSGSQPSSPDASFANYGNNTHTTAYAGSSTPNGWTFSMGTVMERLPVHGNRWRPAIPAWSKIVMFVKLSTYITWDNSSAVNGQLSLIWYSNTSAWGDDALTFSVRNIDTPCECNA